jgi:hypothetical protein
MAGTKISYLAGIGENATPITVMQGNSIAKQPYIEYLGLSEEKLLITLGRESQLILKTTYPNHPDSAAWTRNIERADALLKGVTPPLSMGAVETPADRQFIQFLDYTKGKDQASFMHGPMDTFTLEDCGISTGYWDFDPNRSDGSMVYYPANPDFYGCMLRNARKKGIQDTLNKYLETSAHHVLYNFVGNPNDQTNVVAIKANYHNAFVAETMRLSGLSKDAVILWLRNGIMRESAKKGMGALTPEENIMLLVEGKDDDQFDIGNPNRNPAIGIDPLTVTLIIALASLLIRAYALTQQYKLAMAEKDGSAFAASALALLGTFDASPNNKDFKLGGNTNTGTGVTIPCPTGQTRNAQGICVPITTTPPASTTTMGLTKKQWVLYGGGTALVAAFVLLSSGKKQAQAD